MTIASAFAAIVEGRLAVGLRDYRRYLIEEQGYLPYAADQLVNYERNKVMIGLRCRGLQLNDDGSYGEKCSGK